MLAGVIIIQFLFDQGDGLSPGIIAGQDPGHDDGGIGITVVAAVGNAGGLGSIIGFAQIIQHQGNLAEQHFGRLAAVV